MVSNSRRIIRRPYRPARSVISPSALNAAAAAIQRVWRGSRNQSGSLRQWTSRIKQNQQISRGARKTYSFKQPTTKRVKKFFTVGRMGKPFKKGKTYTTSKFLQQGAVRYVEFGGEISNADCVHVGHSFGVREMWETVIDSLIIKLFKKAGHRIRHLNDRIEGAYDLTFEYYTTQGSPATTQAVTVGSTYQATSVNLQGDMLTILSTSYNTATPVNQLQFGRLYLTVTDAAATKEAEFNLMDTILELDCSSSMALQNRSLADGVADTGNRNEVTNNPIAGKSYTGKGNGTKLNFDTNTLTISQSDLAADGRTGLLQMDVNSTNFTAQMREAYRRPAPPSGFAFVMNCAGVMLQPGQIKNSRLTLKKKLFFNSFWRMLHLQLIQASTEAHSRVNMGFFRLYAFEKKCNTRASENDISVGYEINNVYRCKLYEKRQAILPLMRVF